MQTGFRPVPTWHRSRMPPWLKDAASNLRLLYTHRYQVANSSSAVVRRSGDASQRLVNDGAGGQPSPIAPGW